jgi:DNA-binding NarL/FixJ family response regulator
MTATTKLRLSLADDYPLIMEGVRLALELEEGIEVVSEASNGEELVAQVEEQQPDVVITDIGMPVMNGIEATKKITQLKKAPAVIAFTVFNEEHLVMDMLQAGARGYLLKNALKQTVLDAIYTVHAGRTYFCDETSLQLSKMIADSGIAKQSTTVQFTSSELDVMRLICEQYASKEIAALTQLTVKTVETYRSHILEKTGARNVAGIVIYAMTHGYYQPSKK